MSSGQLQDLTHQEFYDHANNTRGMALEAKKRASVSAAAARAVAEAAEARIAVAEEAAVIAADEKVEAAQRALEMAIGARGLAQRAIDTSSQIKAARRRALATGYFDIIHRGNIIGNWSYETNEAALEDLEQNSRAGKLYKRRFRKNKTKTKRRRHKTKKRR